MRKIIFTLLLLLIPLEARQTGLASYYSVKTNGGTHTASGQRLNDKSMTAAHPTLKMGTVVKVHNLSNGRKVNVTINDRGPFAMTKQGKVIRPLRPHPKRIIDVTQGVARALNFEKQGLTRVRIEVIKTPKR
jgi:rare lipoprotein A